MPKEQSTQYEKGASRDEGLEPNEIASVHQGELFWLFSVKDLIVKYFKAKKHDKEAPKNHVRHEQEEVAMVEVPNAPIDPRAVMVHF